ncbi:MAG: hypothetical protein ACKVHU_09735 [Acidimicrobiales bacterium]
MAAARQSEDEALTCEPSRRKIRVIDARSRHTEAGLADRWNEGQTSRMLTGWSLVAFAATFSDAIASDIAGLSTTAFTG